MEYNSTALRLRINSRLECSNIPFYDLAGLGASIRRKHSRENDYKYWATGMITSTLEFRQKIVGVLYSTRVSNWQSSHYCMFVDVQCLYVFWGCSQKQSVSNKCKFTVDEI